jgi:hypothetical protein
VHTAFDNGIAMADVAKVDIVGVIGGDNSFNHLIVQPEIGSVKDSRGKTVVGRTQHGLCIPTLRHPRQERIE